MSWPRCRGAVDTHTKYIAMKSNLEPYLISKNIQPTAMRLLVFDFLLSQTSAIALTDIEKGLAPADRITIYRTLKTFVENGLIHAIEDGTGSTKYAICKEECTAEGHNDVHVHFYCNQCKETYCLPKSQIPEVRLPATFKLEELSLIAKGVCEKCLNNAIELQ